MQMEHLKLKLKSCSKLANCYGIFYASHSMLFDKENHIEKLNQTPRKKLMAWIKIFSLHVLGIICKCAFRCVLQYFLLHVGY